MHQNFHLKMIGNISKNYIPQLFHKKQYTLYFHYVGIANYILLFVLMNKQQTLHVKKNEYKNRIYILSFSTILFLQILILQETKLY